VFVIFFVLFIELGGVSISKVLLILYKKEPV
jgi:hypothetical protein